VTEPITTHWIQTVCYHYNASTMSLQWSRITVSAY